MIVSYNPILTALGVLTVARLVIAGPQPLALARSSGVDRASSVSATETASPLGVETGPQVRFNELSINPPGHGGNLPFIELISFAPGSTQPVGGASLEGHAIIVVDSTIEPHEVEPNRVGHILEIWPLDGLATGSNGLLLLGNEYKNGITPWGIYPDGETRSGDPEGFGWVDFEESRSVSFFLVSGRNPALIAQGFDEVTDIDTNDDGVMDISLTSATGIILDSVGYDEIPRAYSKPLGISYVVPSAKLTVNHNPDLIARKQGHSEGNSAGVWYGGEYGGSSAMALSLRDDLERPAWGGFRGEATPGRPNLAAEPASAVVKFNEFNFVPVDIPNINSEAYIELIADPPMLTALSGLYIVAIEAAGTNQGAVREAINLSTLTTGTNGLLLIGDSSDDVSPYWKMTSPETHREDPASQGAGTTGYDNDVDQSGERFVWMIVRGWAGGLNDDWDVNNDGHFEIPATSFLLDSLTLADTVDPRIAKVSGLGFVPDSVCRLPGVLAGNSSAAWSGGSFARGPGGNLSVDPAALVGYGDRFFGPFKSEASPGRHNHGAPVDRTATLLLNEVVINPPGVDGKQEFIELLSLKTESHSLNGYTLLMVDSSATKGATQDGDIGDVIAYWPLDGLKTGTNGLALISSGWTAGGPYIGVDAPAVETALGVPLGMLPGQIGRDSNNGAFSLLLVKDTRVRLGSDIDVFGGPNFRGDGLLDDIDGTVVDSVGSRWWNANPGNGEASRYEGFVYGPDLSQLVMARPEGIRQFTADAVARRRGNQASSRLSAWYGGDLMAPSGSAVSVAYDPREMWGLPAGAKVTPGAHNSGSDASPPQVAGVTLLMIEDEPTSIQLAATGGTGSYRFAIDHLPSGLSVTEGGLITGFVGPRLRATLMITVEDSAGLASSQELPYRILRNPTRDDDGDGVPNLIEEAVGSPIHESDGPPSTASIVEIDGQTYGSISFRLPPIEGLAENLTRSRSAAGAFLYEVQVSTDLINWKGATPEDLVLVSQEHSGYGYTVGTYRRLTPFSVDGHAFFRLCVMGER